MNTVLRNAFVALGGLLLFVPAVAQAQFNPISKGVYSTVLGSASVPLQYYGAETLNLSATMTTGSMVFPGNGGMASGIISLTSQYNLNPGRVVTIETGFSNNVALTDTTGDLVPTSAISAWITGGGGTVTNLGNCANASSGQTQIAGNSCGWITFPAIIAGSSSATHTHMIALTMSPSLGLPPGNYTGTLLISAQAN
jgi:hypothetical protein